MEKPLSEKGRAEPGPEIVDRLVCSKYVFMNSVSELDRGGPFSAGIAVGGFQDATEMVLRGIAEHRNVPLKDPETFHGLVNKINQHCEEKLSHTSALIQINKARVNFKHHGLSPKNKDAAKFRSDLEGFFPNAFSTFFGLDYATLSMIELIGHKRTENHLREAEKCYAADDYMSAIYASAAGFEIYRHYISRNSNRREIKMPWNSQTTIDKDSWELFGKLVAASNLQQKVLDLIYQSIPLTDYFSFQSIAPKIVMTRDGSVRGNMDRPSEYNEENARFCISFVTDAIIRLKRFESPNNWRGGPPGRRFRVLADSPVILRPYTQTDRQEVIRNAREGEVLDGHYAKHDKPSYVAIVQDEELAYIRSSDVAEVTEGGD